MNIIIPIGHQDSVSMAAFDGATPPVDITSTGTFTAVCSNSAAVMVTPVPFTSNQFTVGCKGAGSAQITYTFTNPSGTATLVDTINPPDPPASITSSYAAI